MSQYDGYDGYDDRRRSDRGGARYEDDRYDRRDDRRDAYRGPYGPSQELIPRRHYEESVEEIPREFPPPGYGGREMARPRSDDPRYSSYDDDYDDNRSYRSRGNARGGSDRALTKSGSLVYEDRERSHRRMLSNQQKILAAIVGGAIAAGGKEIFDRREAKVHDHAVQRNPLATAAIGAAGALAAYGGAEVYNRRASKAEKRSTYSVHEGRDGKVHEHYSEDEESSGHEKGHKNFLEAALSAAGLGGAIKALTGAGSSRDDRSDTKSRKGSSRSRSRERGGTANKIQKAAMASLIAGATEAFHVSKEPGGWQGEKAKRILTAAAGAATIDAAQKDDKRGKLSLAESVIGGLLGNRLVNGSRKDIEEDKKTGRSRSRSRARSGSRGRGATGLAALATAGLGALGAKKLMDSRGRSQSRNRSVDSYDSRDGSPDRNRRRSRSRSVVDLTRKGLAKLGFGKGPEEDEEDSRDSRHRNRGYDDDDEYEDDHGRDRDRGHGGGGGRRRDEYDDRSHRGRDRSVSRSRGDSRGSRGSSDLGDSSEDEKKARKIRGKQILTTGLAAVATIHAAHNVYQSMEKRNARHRAVREGKLSPEEAQKLKSKALLQDAASVGIAALGIKGALSEMKEARETNHELKEWREEKERRHQRRLERQKKVREANRSDSWDSAAPRRGGSRYDDRDGGYHDRYDDRDGGYENGPHYIDGNPYAALPAPPIGYDNRR